MVNLGLFNPVKYGLKDYLKYGLGVFGDNFRTLHVLKHRNGLANIAKAMWFDGVGNRFEELPKPEDTEILKQFLNDKRTSRNSL